LNIFFKNLTYPLEYLPVPPGLHVTPFENHCSNVSCLFSLFRLFSHLTGLAEIEEEAHRHLVNCKTWNPQKKRCSSPPLTTVACHYAGSSGSHRAEESLRRGWRRQQRQPGRPLHGAHWLREGHHRQVSSSSVQTKQLLDSVRDLGHDVAILKTHFFCYIYTKRREQRCL